MFKHDGNSNFKSEDITIKFPQGYGVGVSIDDWVSRELSEDNLAAFDPENNFCIEWKIETDCESTEKELIDLLAEDDSFIKLSPIEPFVYGGLNGYQAVYRSCGGKYQYFERRYDLGGSKQLVLLITAYTDIKAILEKPEIQELLDNIKRN